MLKYILITAIWLAVFYTALRCAGCANTTDKETLRVEQGSLYYRSEFAQWSLLSFTEARDIERVTPLSSTCIGLVGTESDPNSIDAGAGLLGEALKAIIK